MHYFFVLGTNQAMSFAELSAVFGRGSLTLVTTNVALLECADPIDAKKIIKGLGGTIKIGEILADSAKETNSLLTVLKRLVRPAEGKYRFGFSYYGTGKINVKPLGMELKKFLASTGISCRWVISRDVALSSVVVEQNGLLKNGAEFALIRSGNRLLIGQTLAVQPFKELASRDYGRPSRDDLSGMLPPKLAQIMINLAGVDKNSTILDPFCGSGTILTEAALMGYQRLRGSDLSEKAVEDSRQNIAWTLSKHRIQPPDCRINLADAEKLSQYYDPDSVDAIITEPYLGPQRGKPDTRKVVKELESLYASSLNEFYKILKSGGRVIMAWPVFKTTAGHIMLSQKIIGNFQIVPLLPVQYQSMPGATGRQTLLYGREQQKVWREILLLKKNSK